MSSFQLPHLLTLAAGIFAAGIYGSLSERKNRDRSVGLVLMLVGCIVALAALGMFLPVLYYGERRIGFVIAGGLLLLVGPYMFRGIGIGRNAPAQSDSARPTVADGEEA